MTALVLALPEHHGHPQQHDQQHHQHHQHQQQHPQQHPQHPQQQQWWLPRTQSQVLLLCLRRTRIWGHCSLSVTKQVPQQQ